MSVKTYAKAVRDTIAAEMRRDERVFLMGEDVEEIGSIFGCTRDLTKEFGRERAFNTPISEAGFVGAGLGGGSADAAAVLNGLNELWGLKLPKEQLCAIGAKVGSDVPALVLGGTVLMEGRGERVRALSQRAGRPLSQSGGPCEVRPFDERFVLRVPPVNASTARVYAEFREEDRGNFRNDLQPAACRLYPIIAETIAEMEAEGLENVQMSGSGSAVFGWRKEGK